jgi:hypothetical protein
MQPAHANDVLFALAVSALYGAFSGVFAARAARLWRLAWRRSASSWPTRPDRSPALRSSPFFERSFIMSHLHASPLRLAHGPCIGDDAVPRSHRPPARRCPDGLVCARDGLPGRQHRADADRLRHRAHHWAIFPALGWGLGLLLHGLGVWLSLGGGGLQQRLIDQERARLSSQRDPW